MAVATRAADRAADKTADQSSDRSTGSSGSSGSTGDWSTGAGPVAEAVRSMRHFVATADPKLCPTGAAASLVTLLEEGRRLFEASITLYAARVAEGSLSGLSGHPTPEAWLSSVTGTSPGEAKDILRVGGALPTQPAVEDALRAGRLTTQRAKLVTDAVKVNPGRERDLVQGAEGDTVGQLRERCQRAKAEGRSKEQADAHHRRLHERRRCWTFTDEDGALGLRALFAPEAGAALKAALEVQCDRFFHQARREGRMEPVEAYRADALWALVTGKGILAPETRKKQSPQQNQQQKQQQQHQQNQPSDPAPAEGPDRPDDRIPDPSVTMHVRCDLGALRRGSLGPGEVCEIPGVGPIPVDRARELLGRALLDVVITDGVDVQTVVRLGRHIPAPLLTAITERDQYCVVPGCGKRLGLEKDHCQVDYAEGGVVSYDNIAKLCHHHHQLKTHRGYRLGGGPGHWEWIAPDHPVIPKRPARRRTTESKAPPPPSRAGPTLFNDRE
jgi:hypothetical protein